MRRGERFSTIACAQLCSYGSKDVKNDKERTRRDDGLGPGVVAPTGRLLKNQVFWGFWGGVGEFGRENTLD